MVDFKSKLKRQIEMLGLAMSPNGSKTVEEFAELFGVETLTINRDMQDLRGYGIDIHSERRRGVNLSRRVENDKMKELIQQYLVLSNSLNHMEKATSLLIKKQKDKTLYNIVILQRAIENHCAVIIDYEKQDNAIEHDLEICPLLIFQSENYWRVLANHENKIKQFHLNKVRKVTPTRQTFKGESSEKVRDLFKYSWRSWLGDEQITVKIKLSKEWTERIKPKQLMDVEKFTRLDDGSMIYEVIVNSLNEISSWIVSRGEGVTVLEPQELKNIVIDLAKGTLKNYEGES